MFEQITIAFATWDFWQLLVTATIPLALHHYAKTTTTMNAINELRGKSVSLWNEIDCISKVFDQLEQKDRHRIMSYLNEYDHFCTLFNEGLISRKLARKTRKTTIINAYVIHEEFIRRWRDEYDREAWKNLQSCAERLQKSRKK
tara:strand:- start:1670 stop:2101 length:432 start_codon:yes stop_codon:yes gene_type:complete